MTRLAPSEAPTRSGRLAACSRPRGGTGWCCCGPRRSTSPSRRATTCGWPPTRDGCGPPPRAWTSSTAELADAGFLRVHRRYVVNLDRVREVERGFEGASCCWSWTTGRTRWCRSPRRARRGRALARALGIGDSRTSRGGVRRERGWHGLPPRRAEQRSAGDPTPDAGRANRDWWPEPARPQDPRGDTPSVDPMGADFDYAAAFQTARSRRPGAGRRRGADDLAGLVARRLRPLRPAHDPDGVARRRRRTASATAAAARRAGMQRFAPLNSWPDNAQPGQGAPAAVAGEEEVRPHALLGRPDDLRGQPRAGDDGLHDLRLRRRPGRRLGARRGRLLGPRAHLARRRALHAASASWRSRWPPSRWA